MFPASTQKGSAETLGWDFSPSGEEGLTRWSERIAWVSSLSREDR